jgi:hypothetical protein
MICKSKKVKKVGIDIKNKKKTEMPVSTWFKESIAYSIKRAINRQ